MPNCHGRSSSRVLFINEKVADGPVELLKRMVFQKPRHSADTIFGLVGKNLRAIFERFENCLTSNRDMI